MFPICPKATGPRLKATTIANSMRMVTPLSVRRGGAAQAVFLAHSRNEQIIE
jgi:hypothetical protein